MQKILCKYSSVLMVVCALLCAPTFAVAKAKNKSRTMTLEVKPGDTFSEMMQDAKISNRDTMNVMKALRAVYDPTKIKVGQKVKVSVSPQAGQSWLQLNSLQIKPGNAKRIEVSRSAGSDFQAKEYALPLSVKMAKASGVVDFTMFGAMREAGLPYKIRSQFIKNYSYDVDFQREIQKGDAFEVLYEQMVTEDGEAAGTGNIVFSSLVLRKEAHDMYQYQSRDGEFGYYDEQGKSIQKSFLRTPVDGARITSGFGSRLHPILGFSRMHKGLDFGAAEGTPVYAAAPGTILEMKRKGTYGNYVKINHSNGYATAYAHMDHFNKEFSRGKRVKQGDIIGYVGTTGSSTGPHLHYEVMVDGKQINPLSVKTVAVAQLTGVEYGIFSQYKEQIMRVANKLNSENRLASR